jgi:protein-tyrosine phosphatase
MCVRSDPTGAVRNGMRPYVIEFPASGRLAVMPRPCGGDGLARHLKRLRGTGVDTLICALTPVERDLLGLGAEPEAARSAGLSFVEFPIADFSVPDAAALQSLAKQIAKDIRKGYFVVIHCRGGIGRSGVVAGATLIALGAGADEAMRLVSDARGVPAPETEEQRALLRSLETAPRSRQDQGNSTDHAP